MATGISCDDLKGLLGCDSQFALIDVRESGEYNSTPALRRLSGVFSPTSRVR